MNHLYCWRPVLWSGFAYAKVVMVVLPTTPVVARPWEVGMSRWCWHYALTCCVGGGGGGTGGGYYIRITTNDITPYFQIHFISSLLYFILLITYTNHIAYLEGHNLSNL